MVGRGELDATPPWVELGRHLDLIRLVVSDPTDRRERLHGPATIPRAARRIEDQPISVLEPPQTRVPTVICLREAARYA